MENRVVQKWRDFLQGSIQITNVVKYTIAIYSVAVVHLCLVGFFAYLQVIPLVIFNTCSVLFYLFLGTQISKQRYTLCFLSTYIEIFVHTAVAILLVGWDLGFPIYNLGIVPVSFYITSTIPRFKRKIFYPSLLMAVNLCITIGCRFLVYKLDYVYHIDNPGAVLIMHTFNSVIAYMLVGIFSILFIVEIYAAQLKLQRKNRELESIASIDPLTGLMNRRSLENAFQSIHGNWCVVLGDIDDFKKINDTYGHDCGDEVLVHLANLITEGVADWDYVCRWGGEEILILIQGDLDHARDKVEEIRRVLQEEEFIFEHYLINITMTFGIAKRENDENMKKLVNEADSKLYFGKQHGKNCVVYEDIS